MFRNKAKEKHRQAKLKESKESGDNKDVAKKGRRQKMNKVMTFVVHLNYGV